MNTELTVLLVDDEPSALDTLSTGIHWQQYGVNTILTAHDGVQALELMAEQSVDLLITDIEMPHMDGLTLLSEVRNLYPSTHMILLTAYSEFEYAKRAIQLGVENYLLKPLNIKELEETIDKALDNIYNSRKISQELFRNNILSRWLNGAISTTELSERASLIDVNLYLPEYCIVSISKKNPEVPLSNYCKICATNLSSTYETYYFRNEYHKYFFIIGGSNINLQRLVSLFAEEATILSLTNHISVSIGSPVSDIADLPNSYRTSYSLSNLADSMELDMTVYTKRHFSDQTMDKLTQELHTLFSQSEEETQHDNICKLTEKLFSGVETSSHEELHSLLIHSLLQLFSQEFPNHQEVQEQLKQRIQLFTPFPCKEDFKTAVIELLEYAYLLFNYYFKQLSPIIQAAIGYIHNHYMEGASIKEFCNKSKASTPYLGYLFRKETGMFFNNYLTQYRICVSIQMLLDTDKKINDIALAVGFASPSYYISCFKKQTGISPIKYRSKHFEENPL